MKKAPVIPILFKVLIVCLLLNNYNAFAQKTTIWIVRHAEKATSPADDPELTAEGRKRAEALAKALKHEKIAGIYSTNFKRTMQTAKPTANKFSLVIENYDPADLKAFANKVMRFYKGHSVLIVGHSNTILPTLAAFHSDRPFSILNDDDYDMLFKLTIKNGKTELEITNFGDSHHVTMIPEEYSGYSTTHYVSPPARF